tara:strand:+ start:78 stop:521 length:444 start_codon:yes stop_codon:yes gene_type:complete
MRKTLLCDFDFCLGGSLTLGEHVKSVSKQSICAVRKNLTMAAIMRVWILMMLSAMTSGFFTAATDALGHCFQKGVESRVAKINHIMALKDENKEGKKKKIAIKNINKGGKGDHVMPPPMRGDKVDKTENDEHLFSFPRFRDCERVTK